MTNTKTKEQGRHTRRPASQIPILTPLEVDEICKRADHIRDACMISLLYMSGRRISEVLPLRKRDFNYSQPGFDLEKSDGIISFTCMNEKSFRQTKDSTFNIKKRGVFHEKRVHKTDPPGKEYYVRYYQKIEPKVSTLGPSGKALWWWIRRHLDNSHYDDYLFRPYGTHTDKPISRSQAYSILVRLEPRIWLHSLRHMNFTRLAEVYADDPREMHALTFHRQFENTLIYIQRKETKEKLKQL